MEVWGAGRSCERLCWWASRRGGRGTCCCWMLELLLVLSRRCCWWWCACWAATAEACACESREVDCSEAVERDLLDRREWRGVEELEAVLEGEWVGGMVVRPGAAPGRSRAFFFF